MTPPPGPSAAAATRAPLPLLILLYLIPLAVAAVTPIADLRSGPQGDVGLYLDKAYGVLRGLAPYRDVPLEYPPFALVPMVVPYALWPFGPPTLSVYAWLFAGQMAVLLVALGLVVGRIAGLRATWPADAHADTPSELRAEQRRVGIRLLILAVGASLALTWRFDLFPVLLATVALWAALERRPVVAGAAIGIGVLAKLFPLVVAPVLALVWLAPLDRSRLARFTSTVVAGPGRRDGPVRGARRRSTPSVHRLPGGARPADRVGGRRARPPLGTDHRRPGQAHRTVQRLGGHGGPGSRTARDRVSGAHRGVPGAGARRLAAGQS